MISIVKSHDEDCVSAHALYKALELTTPPYAKWVDSWFSSAKENLNYFKGEYITPNRGAPYADYFLPLKFAKDLCEKRRKPKAGSLAIFLGAHIQLNLSTPLMTSDKLKENELVVEPIIQEIESDFSEDDILVEPQDILSIIGEAWKTRASFGIQRRELKARLARLDAEEAAFIKQTIKQLGISS